MSIRSINYGFGKEYLSKWDIKEALREVYQNYLDFGEYVSTVKDISTAKNIVEVTLINKYIPNKLEFLRIGNSDKQGNVNAIGHHGEGLKMAFLVFLRKGLWFRIFTDKYEIYAKFVKDPNIGETMSIFYKEHNLINKSFTTEFRCDKNDYDTFVKDIITKPDIIYSDAYHGDVVNRDTGNIYSGRLWVCKLDNLTNAYNIPPSQLPLDRDRMIPRPWDITYHTSKVNQGYARWTTLDTNYSDTEYIDVIPQHIKEQYKPYNVGNQIEFVTESKTGEIVILKNDSIKQALLKDNFFTKSIHTIKKYIASKFGLYELLIQFQEKHVYTEDAKHDFAIILEVFKA